MHAPINKNSGPLLEKLRLEAITLVKKQQEAASDDGTLGQIVTNLTGLSIGLKSGVGNCTLEEAHKLLERRLRVERRKSRTWSPLYDVNRHIALHQALKQISQKIAQTKTPT